MNERDDPGSDPAFSDEAAQEAEQLRDEIAETREELGDTVEALTEKADVKAQVEEKKAELKGRVEDKKAEVRDKLTGAVGPPVQQARERPWIPAAVGIGAGLLLLVVLRRRGS